MHPLCLRDQPAVCLCQPDRGRAAAVEFGRFVTCRLGTMVLDAAIMLAGGNWLAGPGQQLVLLVLGRWVDAAAALPSGAWGSRRFPMCW